MGPGPGPRGLPAARHPHPNRPKSVRGYRAHVRRHLGRDGSLRAVYSALWQPVGSLEMPLTQVFKGWYARELSKRRSIRERLVRLEPLRAAMLPSILAVCFVALAVQAALFVWSGVPKSKFFPGGTTIWPALCLLVSAGSLRWGPRKWRTQFAISTLFVAIAFAVTWSQAALLKPGDGYPQYGGVLILTILLSGLLIGEFYVGAWTFICCVSLQFAIMDSSGWRVNAGWCAVYITAGWLVIQFS